MVCLFSSQLFFTTIFASKKVKTAKDILKRKVFASIFTINTPSYSFFSCITIFIIRKTKTDISSIL